MNIYIQMALVSAVTVYIVDLSGFTDAWRGALSRCLGIRPERLRPLPPLDCGQCMSWWVCLLYAACSGGFGLATVAWSAFLAFMSTVTGQLLLLLREAATSLINKAFEKL